MRNVLTIPILYELADRGGIDPIIVKDMDTVMDGQDMPLS